MHCCISKTCGLAIDKYMYVYGLGYALKILELELFVMVTNLSACLRICPSPGLLDVLKRSFKRKCVVIDIENFLYSAFNSNHLNLYSLPHCINNCGIINIFIS